MPSTSSPAGGGKKPANATTVPEEHSAGRIRLIAALATTAGIVLCALEIHGLLHPDDPSIPAGGVFWLVLGVVMTGMGILELVLGGRDIPSQKS